MNSYPHRRSLPKTTDTLRRAIRFCLYWGGRSPITAAGIAKEKARPRRRRPREESLSAAWVPPGWRYKTVAELESLLMGLEMTP